jgi:hypothetical protein
MAREAGFTVGAFGGRQEVLEGDGYHIQTDEVERFAALVAAAEREACAQILDRNANACANSTMLADVLHSNANAIRARGKE